MKNNPGRRPFRVMGYLLKDASGFRLVAALRAATGGRPSALLSSLFRLLFRFCCSYGGRDPCQAIGPRPDQRCVQLQLYDSARGQGPLGPDRLTGDLVHHMKSNQSEKGPDLELRRADGLPPVTARHTSRNEGRKQKHLFNK